MVKFCHFATKAARRTEFCLMSCHCLNLAPWPYQRQSSLQCQFTPPACFKPLSEAVVDSGTSLLAVPTPIFPELYEMLRHGVTKVFGEIGWKGFLSTLAIQIRVKTCASSAFTGCHILHRGLTRCSVAGLLHHLKGSVHCVDLCSDCSFQTGLIILLVNNSSCDVLLLVLLDTLISISRISKCCI